MVKLDTFWEALKYSWFKRLTTTADVWPEILVSELGNQLTRHDLLFAGPSQLKTWAKTTSNPFWKEVLDIGANMINEAAYATPEQFPLLPLFDNPLFKIGNRVLGRERLQGTNSPISLVADLLDPLTNLPLSRLEFNRKYYSNIPARSYEAIINSINRAVDKLNLNWGSLETHPAPRQSILLSINVN